MARLGFLTAGAAAAVIFGSPTMAAVLYATGFEPPTFSVGPLAGQGGWAVYSASSQSSDVTVEDSLAYQGAQAVAVTDVSGQTGPYYDYGPIAPTRPITVSAEIYVTSGNWQFAVTGYGLSQYAGGIDFSAGGAIRAITSGFPDVGTTFTADAWHDVAITLNYATQTYGLTLDGSPLASNLSFCGNNSNCNGASIPQFGAVFFDAFSTTGAGYIDDVSISTAPEPAAWTLMLAGAGVLGAALRRKGRTRASA